MEQELATLAATVAELQAKAAATGSIFSETFYYLTIPLMVLIHVGFLAYEMGASRSKNALASGIKNILAFAMIVPFFYYVGWWIYWAFPTGLSGAMGAMEISGFAYANEIASPTSPYMGPNLGDQASGVFWGAFVLFAATTASILSGAVIERIQLTGFIALAVVLGAFIWILAAAWGWHADGWLVTKLGYHDFGASGVVHMIAGFFALGVLINLGPRIGKFNADGSANQIAGHSMPMTLIGLMLIIAGFWGFLMGCVIVPGEAWSWSGKIETSIYGTPMTMSGMTFNVLMAFAGGIIGAWMTTRDPFWMMSGALGGIISAAAGIDLWWPPLAFVIGFIGASMMPFVASFIERMKIDDAVGAFTVHGFLGLWGVLAVGIVGSGYPALFGEADVIEISFMGQLGGAAVMALLGFVPGYAVSFVLKAMGMLRVPESAELLGLDLTKVPSSAYPESIHPSVSPAE
ncbi:ammonium transporter [Roseovarius nubinhibens]|uniref:Ammonium transporter n=1 Tax=Roseovarius nubinhibens (strain ATCC BAA-591 / DSM 15170 / ISM) TaxID=89187 RepID=A3SLM4_ROSNI|nr:ammonium transporter [Roseovarius nubinhibens]EAP78255.1 ammonium transporter [Roseovarius nubinhibens ISM]